MGLMVRMRNPATKKIEVMSPQNALDMEQHQGWKRLGNVQVKDSYISSPQELLDKTGTGRKSTAQASLDPSDPANSRVKPKVVKTIAEAEQDDSDDLAEDLDDEGDGEEDVDGDDESKLADKM